MRRDKRFEISVRKAWMRGDASLFEVMVADRRLIPAGSELVIDHDPEIAADRLLESVPAWVRWVGRGGESIGLPLALLALVVWFVGEVPEHPGYLGLGGLAAIGGAWVVGEVLNRWGKAVWLFGAFVFGAGVPVLLALELPGPDIGIPLPPVWPTAVLGVLGGCAYLYRLIRAAPLPDDGIPMLVQLWRAGGTKDSAIRSMTEEMEDLAASREEEGRPKGETEWHDQGLVVDWPDQADPERHWRLALFALAGGAFVAAGSVAIDAATSVSLFGRLDGSTLRPASLIIAVAALPGALFTRRGRWLLIGIAALTPLAFLIPRDTVVGEIHLVWAVIATVSSAAITWRRRPRNITEAIDRLM